MKRDQATARKILAAKYPFACCAICGLQIATCLQVAHLDQNATNNSPENLAYLCPTHHWMYDAALYPVEAIWLLQAHWQKTGGVPNHSGRMKDAGPKAAKTRGRRTAAKKAVVTRQANKLAIEAKLDPKS